MRDWQSLAETSWIAARQKAWLTAMVVAKRNIHTCKISPTDMSQLRGAWEMYRFLRSNRPQDARRLRKQYPYRRFYELFRLWRVYEFSPDECIEHLDFDGGVSGMVCQIQDVHGLPEWERKGAGIYSTVAKFTAVAYGAPSWFVTWARNTKELFEANGIK